MALCERCDEQAMSKMPELDSDTSTSQETVQSFGNKRPNSSEENRVTSECNSVCGASISLQAAFASETCSDSKLKFGLRLERIFIPPRFHPLLYTLLQFIYVNGPLVTDCNFTDLSPIDADDKREVKSRLRTGRSICLANYTLPAILHVVQSFLRHLPQPLLRYNLFHTWVATGDVIHQHCCLPAKRDLVIHAIQQLLTELNAHELLLLRHLLASLRSLTQPLQCKCPDLGRVHEMAHLFASAILRRRLEWPGSNPKTEAKVALLTFFILQFHRIFGPSVKSLFPTDTKCSASCCNLIEDTPAMQEKENVSNGHHILHSLLDTCLPISNEVPKFAEIDGAE